MCYMPTYMQTILLFICSNAYVQHFLSKWNPRLPVSFESGLLSETRSWDKKSLFNGRILKLVVLNNGRTLNSVVLTHSVCICLTFQDPRTSIMRELCSCSAGSVSLLWVAWLSVGLIANPSASGKIVTSHRMLTVSIGKTIFIQPEDLTVLPPGDAPCLVTVTEKEPIWTRAGKISPQVITVSLVHSTIPP